MVAQEQTDLTKLRYVLYARKSTEDETRQVRSIDDQIKDCRKLADDLGLRVVDVIRETKSAKKPDQRPKFNQMLKDIEAKRYDAILCWHPDRLCRNMLEGGRIINMLDEGVLQDIRFQSHQFSNDANGKMLLGMLFVFSKQYSDDLSTKVLRGHKGNFSEGKSSGSPKWGYDRNEMTGLYEPNDFFDLVRAAWRKREQGESVEGVTKFLVESGYYRLTKSRKNRPAKKIRPAISTTAKMFRDPFYYGLLVQANQIVDLREIYDFQPMISEETFNHIQALGYARTRDRQEKKRATFYPLRAFVYCAVCNSSKHLQVGKNKTGSGKYVLSYRCDNPACTRKPKSLRAKNVFNSLYDYLERIELTDEAYSRYSQKLDSQTDEKIIEIKRQIQSLRGALTHITSGLDERALNIVSFEKTSLIYKTNQRKIDELATQKDDIEQRIAKLEKKVADPRQIKLSKEQFLNVVKTASGKMRAGSAVEKDVLCRILFLNLRVDNEKVVEYLWKEPFASLVKVTELSLGRRCRI
ncbi:MAG TPA: recombinase family protein [Candidatus Saccharimonadales bacterium]|nr:recombinase family protein [Candidatus Saccharimonadales bacterium]